MKRKTFDGMNCSIARALEEVGEWWSLLIIREMTQGATRFEDIQRELGIARNILATRLVRLVALGIVEKFLSPERLNTDAYRLTRKGEDLYPVLVALMQWGDRWLAPGGKGPMALVEDGSGEAIERIEVRIENGKPLSFKDIRLARGPGATNATDAVIEGRNQKVLGHK